MIYSLELSRLIVAGVVIAGILALARRPKWLPLVAVAGWLVIYGPVAAGRLQAWNVFHYWLNTKYVGEVGFTDFYNCAYEAAPADFGDMARNLATYQIVPINTLPPCPRENFTPARWAEFQSDLAWLKSRPGRPQLWDGMIRDKGLNTTPTWLAFAVPLANALPAGGPAFWLAMYADFMLLLLALLAVAWLRSVKTASLMAIFLLTWIGNLPQLMGHWFQYVWLALLLLAMLAWHRRRWAAAGAFLALAAALRIFPGLLFTWPLLHWRRIPRRFWTGAAVAGITAVAAGSFTPMGLHVWPAFLAKMAQHSAFIVTEPGNMGLRNLVDTLVDSQGAIADWSAFAMGEIQPGGGQAAPGWAWLAVAVFGGLALVALARRPKMNWGDGLLLLFPTLVLSRYYYAIMVLNFDQADDNEAVGLLLINLLCLVLMYWLHPLLAYQVGQFVIFLYLVGKVNKWTSLHPARRLLSAS